MIRNNDRHACHAAATAVAELYELVDVLDDHGATMVDVASLRKILRQYERRIIR